MFNIKRNFYGKLIFLLVFIFVVQSFSACSSKNSNNNNNETNDGENTTSADSSAETTEQAISDDVPELNFNGETVSILYRDYMQYEVTAEAENGDVINDAVYRRNAKIEDRFNIKFNMISTKGAWDYKDDFENKVKNSVSAGDNEFEIIDGYAAYILELTFGGYLNNWKDIPYIGFDKPWWNQNFINEMTINGKLYFLTGDLALSTIWESNALFFNKVMWQNYGFENPYNMVKAGKWTLDNMAQITRQVSKDLNGDGKFDESDLYGYVTDTYNQVDAYTIALDAPVTAKGNDGLPQFIIDQPRYTEAFTKLYDFMRGDVSTFAGNKQPTSTDIYSMYRPMFQNQQALILAEYLGNSSQMRGFDFDFGILPFPKYDENQAEYKTMPQNGYTMFCTPVTIQNPEKIGAVTEAMAAESYKTVLPAFYDVALKTKYARDDESAEMIDIIRDGISFNFGIEYAFTIGGSNNWRGLVTDKNSNITSWVDKNLPKLQLGLEKVLAIYEQ
ncbi:MAG: hypothetical protein FWD71_12085 [Oscillospiraceae bacterium]|nr:hypothetical protein [Oscillospiraceae bacterium]